MIDEQGEFRTTLKQGAYTCEFSSLGYERKTVSVTIDKPVVSLEIKLDRKVYLLKEVIVSAKREDPAYEIMRRAIAMAPFYLHQVKTYQSEIYTKGTMKVDKMPRLLKITTNNQQIKDIVGKLFVLESQSEVKFTAPNNYEEKILAFSTTIPFDMEASNPLDIMTTNIYDPDMMGRISPLSQGAFSYYSFTFEGVTTEGDHLVNKIRVQPKKKNPKLSSGWLYIIENTWNVFSADLSTTELGVNIRFKANYKEVKPAAFLPVTYDIDMKIDMMGVGARGKYYASIQYKDISLNEGQTIISQKENQPEIIANDKPQTKKQQKALKQLEALSAKEELSNRDAYKMSKLMREVIEPEEIKKQRESLHLLPSESKIKVTVDSLAKSRDSLYWSEIRDLPLRTEEIMSYQQTDSLKIKKDSSNVEVVISTPKGGIGSYILGNRIKLGKKSWLGYNGLLGIVPEYNFVDGVWLGQRFTYAVDFTKHTSLHISPSIFYVTARKTVNWQIDGRYTYAPLKRGELTISGGNTSTDYNSESGNLRLINSLASLFFAENPIKFYQKKFIEANNKIDLANGLLLETNFMYEKRNELKNNISYSFFGGKPSSNIPGNQLLPMLHHSAAIATVKLDYTPRHYYWIERGRKIYAHSAYPTFSLSYRKAFAGNSNKAASFDRLEAGIRQEIKLNAFDKFNYSLNAGKFLTSKRLYFPDYKHFNTNELFVSGSSLLNSFSLLDNYTCSTDKQWLQAHLAYTSPYLLFKHLPFLQNYLFDESLHARTLWIPGKNYTELGYSAGIYNVARIGVFIGLDKGKYDAVGFTISLPILKTMGIR